MQESKDAANGVTTAAFETIEKAKDLGREALDKGYEGVREYASKSMDYADEVSAALAEFARRQPWLALLGAFAVGYVAAQSIRRLSL